MLGAKFQGIIEVQEEKEIILLHHAFGLTIPLLLFYVLNVKMH